MKASWTIACSLVAIALGGGALQAQEQEGEGICIFDVSIGSVDCTNIVNWIYECDQAVQEECGNEWTTQTATCGGGNIHCQAIRTNT